LIEDTNANHTLAWVLHPAIKSEIGRKPTEPALKEAVALAEAMPKLDVHGATVVPLSRPQAGMLFGKGKIDELRIIFADNKIELVLIDGPVTPVQQRNLEKIWSVKILDRTGLILEIFSDRAATREGSLQVEMAALTYQRTRLVRAWTHLERQRGGLGFVGGPGETQIEADRRAIDLQLSKLRQQLAKVVKTRTLHRSSRAKVPYPIVALVGYTNAGKSTLFNRLTGAKVLAKNMLFATLDPCMRAIRSKNGTNMILSDTVGFVSNLPTELVAAFRATLEEVLTADMILHVRDISHEATQEQANDVTSILETLGINENTPLFEIWNKTDLLSEEEQEFLLNQSKRSENIYQLSAISGKGMEIIVDAVEEYLTSGSFEDTISLSHKDGKKRAWLYAQGVVTQEVGVEAGIDLALFWSARQKAQFASI
jgi:GTP-binding protein HflX